VDTINIGRQFGRPAEPWSSAGPRLGTVLRIARSLVT